jgi:hypothetical protein
MNRDSKLAIDVIKGCQKADIPVLSLHDGFKVPERHVDKVQEIIEAAAARTFNNLKAYRVRVSSRLIPHTLPSSLLPPPFRPFHLSLAGLVEGSAVEVRCLAGPWPRSEGRRLAPVPTWASMEIRRPYRVDRRRPRSAFSPTHIPRSAR